VMVHQPTTRNTPRRVASGRAARRQGRTTTSPGFFSCWRALCVAVLDDLRTGEVIDGESCCGLSLYRSTHRYATKGRSIKREAKDFETFKPRTSLNSTENEWCKSMFAGAHTEIHPRRCFVPPRACTALSGLRALRSRYRPIFYLRSAKLDGWCTKPSCRLCCCFASFYQRPCSLRLSIQHSLIPSVPLVVDRSNHPSIQSCRCDEERKRRPPEPHQRRGYYYALVQQQSQCRSGSAHLLARSGRRGGD